MMQSILSIVLPVHNEQGTIENTILSIYGEICSKVPCEFLVCEDGSTDETKSILSQISKRLPLKLIASNQRKGYSKALIDALQQATSPLILIIESDGQHNPRDFWALVERCREFDMVIGRKKHRRDPPQRILLAKAFNTISNLLFRTNLHDIDCAFRLVRREVVHNMLMRVKILPHSFWAEFTIRACKEGYKVTEVPISHYVRNGSSHIYRANLLPRMVFEQLKGLRLLRMELSSKSHKVI